jgi:endonuclease III related protein
MRSTSGKSLFAIYTKLRRAYGSQAWWPARTRFEVIVGAILTQNTAWINVEKAIASLRRARMLEPEAMNKASEKTLASLIRPAGYYNIKAHRLKNFLKLLFSRFDGRLGRMDRLPTDALRNQLLEVSGIGPETCDSILLYAFKRPVFVVDAYTKRIFSRHGFFSEHSDYHAVQKYFMDRLPADEGLFNEYHALIVRLAKEYCKKTRRQCANCLLRETRYNRGGRTAPVVSVSCLFP